MYISVTGFFFLLREKLERNFAWKKMNGCRDLAQVHGCSCIFVADSINFQLQCANSKIIILSCFDAIAMQNLDWS